MAIKALRISFVFTETILDLQLDVAVGAPLEGFVTEPGFRNIVDDLQNQKPAPLGLMLPWPSPVGHHFWDYYLNQRTPEYADGKLCFEKLVPLRLPKLADKVEADLASKSRVTMEGFYFTYGVGLLITVDLSGEFDLATAGDLALRVRNNKIFKTTLAPTDASLSLQQVATTALNRLRTMGFGAKVAGTPNGLFSVATVVSCDGVNPNQPLKPDGEVHRLLGGLSGWVNGWRGLSLSPPVSGETQLRTRTSDRPGDVLYAAKRGRAVWFPSLFDPKSTRHSLGCYHRNLTLGSLQAESLLGLASAVEETFAEAAIPSTAIQRLGQLAAGLLARLHGGAKTYASDSLRAQVAQSRALPDVESLRKRFGMIPIASAG